MAMRVTGMMSGLDTESIIQELVAVKQTKVDTLKKEQTKLEWKQDVWKELNNKIKKFYFEEKKSYPFFIFSYKVCPLFFCLPLFQKNLYAEDIKCGI